MKKILNLICSIARLNAIKKVAEDTYFDAIAGCRFQSKDSSISYVVDYTLPFGFPKVTCIYNYVNADIIKKGVICTEGKSYKAYEFR